MGVAVSNAQSRGDQKSDGQKGPTGAKFHKDLLKGSFSGGEYGAFNAVHRLQNHNQELQEYHKGSVKQDHNSGEITIKAEKHSDGKITSGKIETKNVWTTASDPAVKNRGYVEVRATLPAKVNGDKLVGAWPAIWLLGYQPPVWPHCGELDIVELAKGAHDDPLRKASRWKWAASLSWRHHEHELKLR